MSEKTEAAADAAAAVDLVRAITRPKPRVVAIVDDGAGGLALCETVAGITHRLPVSASREEVRELAAAILACWSPSTPEALAKLAIGLLSAEGALAALGRGPGGLQ